MISTKNKEWKYENEWRLTCYLKDGNFDIPARFLFGKRLGHDHKLYYKDCIKRIILGQKFFHPDNSTYDSDGKITVYAYKGEGEQNRETYDFLNYIYDNYKNYLFMSDADIHREDHYITRVLYQIRLEKIDDRAFSICPAGKPFR